MSTAALERYTSRSLSTVGPPIALAGLMTALLVRLLPDVSGKPLHEDEAVAGLIAARPLGEVLQTVVLDRGGAPFHFVLAHVALQIDMSADALRWLSVVFALATVPLCYDLARRLAGPLAGLTGAALAATSQLLLVYGTFGRMYSLFVFASALAADLFVRTLERPSLRSALATTAAGLLAVAIHPFGVFLFASGLAVSVWVWRTPTVVAIALLAVPLLLADARLADRYAGKDLDSGMSAAEAALRALGGAAGGYGFTLVAFAVLAVIGLVVVRRAFAAFACLALIAPPFVLAVAGSAGLVSDRLSPRHFIFALPLWITLVAAGVARIAPLLPAVAIVAVAGALAPAALADPRSDDRAVSSALNVSAGDVLYPYSPPFLAALPEAADARGWPREPVALARIAARTTRVPAVFVAVPTRTSWQILKGSGPFRDGPAVLTAILELLRTSPPSAYREQLRGTACAALVRLGSTCYPVATSTDGTSPHRSSSR